MRKSVGEITFCVVLIGFIGFALMESFQIRGSAAGGSLSPAFFPKVICTILLTFLTITLFGSFRKLNDEKSPSPSSKINKLSIIAWIIVLSELVVYSMILEPLGYIASTTLLIFSVVSTLSILSAPPGERVVAKGFIQLILFSSIVSVTIYVLFSQGFGLVLPKLGMLGI